MQNSDYSDLHLHSTYSLLDGFGTLEQIVKKAKELGRKSVALTDHGMVSGFTDLEKACKTEGIKPIYGCEFYVTETIEAKQRHHLTVLAKNAKGYKNVLNMATKAWENTYYDDPMLPEEFLFAHSNGLFVFSGCTSGKLARLLIDDRYEDAKAVAVEYAKMFPESYYLEIQPFDLDACKKVNKGVQRIANETGIPMISTTDVHYLDPSNAMVHKILRAISLRRKLSELDDSCLLHPRTLMEVGTEYKKLYGDSINWVQAIKNIPKVADQCEQYTIPKADFLKIHEDSDQLIRTACEEKLVAKGLSDNKEYRERLERELTLIAKKKFSDYFLVVWDMVKWSKTHNVFVGPSRGSSAGSLMCYLLGITEVDPLRYGLLLERFIDENRSDYPDIDVDFDSSSRDLVVEYMKEKYGHENVALVSTFAEFKGKNSIDEVRRVYDLSIADANGIKKFLLERSIADARASFTIEDTMAKFPQVKRIIDRVPEFMYAKLLEGQTRHLSIHAAGIVVSQSKLEDVVALYEKKGSKLTSCDKFGVEYLNMLKIDVLALKTLSIMKNICTAVGMTYQDLLDIKLDDPVTFEGFAKNDLRGVFQFDGEATSSITGPIAPTKIEDLIDIVALSKPGPLHSRSTRAYIDIKQGKKKLKGDTPEILQELTKDTYGQILFQEQVMTIVREIGGFSWEDTTKIRKAMAKSMGQEFMGGFKEKFIKGALERNVPEKQANDIWNKICTHGSWSFNKSHAAGYAILGFWQMYLKQHYPLEFYWATILEEDHDDRKRDVFLIDMMQKGYDIYPPNVNDSKMDWTIEKGGLRAGLTNIPGFGPKIAQAIAENQPYTDFADMQRKIGKRLCNAKVQRLVEQYKMFEANTSDFMPVVKMYKQLQHPKANCKIGEMRWMDEARYNMVLCCMVKSKMLYNIHEEDQIKGVHRDYKDPDKADFMTLTLEDATGQVKAEVDRYNFVTYKDLLWSLQDTDIVLVLGDQPEGRRHVQVKKIKKLGEENGDQTVKRSDGNKSEAESGAQD